MSIPAPPTAPNPLSSDFATQALAFTNWMHDAAPQFDAAADLANDAVADAQQAVTDAAEQVNLAAAQASNASDSADAATSSAAAADDARALAVAAKTQSEAARDMSQTYAAIAGASAGLPALAGEGSKGLYVKPDESGVEWRFPVAGAHNLLRDVKSSAYTVVAADKGNLLDCTGTWTLGVTSASILGSGWWAYVRNYGSGVITVDPSGGELIDGAATRRVLAGMMVLLLCTGSAFLAIPVGPVDDDPYGTLYGGPLAPVNGTWLECNGATYLQSAYPNLYAAIGAVADAAPNVGLWAVNAGVTSSQEGLCWSGTEFLSCGGSVILRLGADGSGNTAASHTGSNLSGIASNGAGVAVATPYIGTGTVRTTDGGATWAAGGSITSGAGKYLAHGNGVFLAIGNSLAATSTDGGASFTARTFSGNPSCPPAHLGGGNWAAAVGFNPANVTRTTDGGATWSAGVATGLSSISGLVKIKGKLVAVGTLPSVFGGTPGMVVSNDDGATFSGAISLPTTAASPGVAAIGGVLVVIGSTNSVTWSVDVGQSWQTATTPNGLGSSTVRMAYGNGRLVLVNGNTSNGAARMQIPALTYNLSTQFATPLATTPFGTKQWIKAA